MMKRNSFDKLSFVILFLAILLPLLAMRITQTSPYPPQRIKMRTSEMAKLSQIMHQQGFQDTTYFGTFFSIAEHQDYKWFEKSYPNSSSKLYINLTFPLYSQGLDVHMFQDMLGNRDDKQRLQRQMKADFEKVKARIGQEFTLRK